MKVGLVRGRWHSVWESLSCGYLYSATKDLTNIDLYSFWDGYFESDDKIIKGASECDIVGFSGTTSQMPWSVRIAAAIKERNPNTRIYLGGYGPSVDPGNWANRSGVDGVVVGEGEVAWRAIIESEGRERGVIFRPAAQDLDSIPFPDRDFIQVERCIAIAKKEEGRRVTSVLGNRGCLRRCKFCADGSPLTIYGRKLRERSPGNILDEMERVRDDHRIEFFKFADAEVNTRPGRAREIATCFLRRKWEVPWGGNFLVNPLDGGDAKALYAAGCREVWMGLESGSPEILQHIGKGTNLATIRKAFKATKEAGLLRRAYVLMGTPLETKETIKMTEAMIDEVRPDTVSFSILAPYPGTEYYDEAKHGGLDWEHIDEYGGSNPWRTDALSHEELLQERLRLIEKYRGHLSTIMAKKIALGIIDTGEIALPWGKEA